MFAGFIVFSPTGLVGVGELDLDRRVMDAEMLVEFAREPDELAGLRLERGLVGRAPAEGAVRSVLVRGRAVIANGGVFAQMPEGTVSGPPGRLGPLRCGRRAAR